MEMSTISIRISADDKSRFESFCNNTGLNISTAINIFIKSVLMNNSIPFVIKCNIPASNNMPNALTASAIEEGDRLVSDPDQEE